MLEKEVKAMAGETVEETLRDVCSANVDIATDIKTALYNALGTCSVGSAVGPLETTNIIDQALNSAQETRNLLQVILDTITVNVLNRI